MKMSAKVNTLIKTVPVVESEATLAASKLAGDRTVIAEFSSLDTLRFGRVPGWTLATLESKSYAFEIS